MLHFLKLGFNLASFPVIRGRVIPVSLYMGSWPSYLPDLLILWLVETVGARMNLRSSFSAAHRDLHSNLGSLGCTPSKLSRYLVYHNQSRRVVLPHKLKT